MRDSIGLYFDEIGKFPLLTADDERELAQKIETGIDARNDRRELLSAIGHLSIDKDAVPDIDIRAINSFLNETYESADTPEQKQALEDSPYLELLSGLQHAEKIAQEGQRAKEKFINSNLRLVVSLAKRYPTPQGMDLLDLIQEGNLGLEHAVDKFDWKRGFKFSTYATYWIRQAIGRALNQKESLIRIPGDRAVALRAALNQVGGDRDRLDSEQAEISKISSHVSLDTPINNEPNSSTIGDLIPSSQKSTEDQALQNSLSDEIQLLLDVLDPRERLAIEMRYGFQDGEVKSYREVGERLGLTTEGARRLVNKTQEVLREIAENGYRRQR